VRIQDVVTHLGGRIHTLESSAEVARAPIDEAVFAVIEMGSGDAGDWLKAAQALNARRPELPVLAFGSHVDVAAREAARRAGCAYVWSKSRFVTDFPALAARMLQPDVAAPGCDDPLPELARHGVELFNQGAYYRCHDALEAAWAAERRACRLLYQGILQLAIGLHHIQRGNYPGALKMLARAENKFQRLPGRCQGLDVSRLLHLTGELKTRLKQLGPERLHEFPAEAFPLIPLPAPS